MYRNFDSHLCLNHPLPTRCPETGQQTSRPCSILGQQPVEWIRSHLGLQSKVLAKLCEPLKTDAPRAMAEWWRFSSLQTDQDGLRDF